MVHPIGSKLRLRTVAVALFIFLQFLPNLLHAQTSLRKIGELELQVQGISATVQPANPTIPKNTPAGVRIVVSTPSGTLTSDDVAKFVGGSFEVHGELSGPGLSGTITLPFIDPNGGGTPIVDPADSSIGGSRRLHIEQSADYGEWQPCTGCFTVDDSGEGH